MKDSKNNTGKENTGYGNSGYGNSGYGNSGDWNSGYGNSTSRESGIFNSEPGTIRMFNQSTNKRWDDIDHPHFDEFYLTKWIPENEMIDEEKKNDPRQGYLKTFTYKEAWANFWKDTDENNRKKFLALPNFDKDVFFEITGINVEENSKKHEMLKKADELIAKAE